MLDILNKINQPEDLRNIEINDLEKLSEEIREVLLQKLSKNGGHFGPNFGMVEAIIAMHYVFDSPKDKMIFEKYMETYTDAKPGMPFFLKMKGNTVIQILEKPMA